MTTTDQQLKQALAKMLPGNVRIVQQSYEGTLVSEFYWVDTNAELRDTEWMHVCFLIKQTLTVEERIQCIDEIYKLRENLRHPDFDCAWQLEAQALIKVKGIEL